MTDPEAPAPHPTRPGRPLSVWIVSVWYFFSGFFSISMIAAVQSRLAHLPAQEAAAPASRLETGDILLAAFLIALNLSGAGFLFLLRKTAVNFFKAALALNVGTNVWYLFTRGFGEEPVLMAAGVLLGWLVAAAVCSYSANLAKNGILK